MGRAPTGVILSIPRAPEESATVLGPTQLPGKWVLWDHHGVFKMHLNVFGRDVQFSLGCTIPTEAHRLKATPSHISLACTAPGIQQERPGCAAEATNPPALGGLAKQSQCLTHGPGQIGGLRITQADGVPILSYTSMVAKTGQDQWQ